VGNKQRVLVSIWPEKATSNTRQGTGVELGLDKVTTKKIVKKLRKWRIRATSLMPPKVPVPFNQENKP